MIDCTLLGLSVQAAHVDLQFEMLHTAGVAHAGDMQDRHTKAYSTPMPVFRFVIDAHGCEQCAGKHVARNRSDSWVAVCGEIEAAEPCAIAASFGSGPEGLYRLCHLWSLLILFLGCVCCAMLCHAVLCCAALCCAALCCAVLEMPCPVKQAAVWDLL